MASTPEALSLTSPAPLGLQHLERASLNQGIHVMLNGARVFGLSRR